ncbi:MAG: hypothetical protein M5R42_12750 [Rhodocyclaceae bacterium]|nr:hypothetical protein [Rhodocyclaceae bacterium]
MLLVIDGLGHDYLRCGHGAGGASVPSSVFPRLTSVFFHPPPPAQ